MAKGTIEPQDLDIRRRVGLIISTILITTLTGVWIATKGLTNPIKVAQPQGYSQAPISTATAEAEAKAAPPAAETAVPNEVPQEAAAQPEAKGQAREADLTKQEAPTAQAKRQPPKKIARKAAPPARQTVRVASRSDRYVSSRRPGVRRLTFFFSRDEDRFDRDEKRKERKKRRSDDDY